MPFPAAACVTGGSREFLLSELREKITKSSQAFLS